VYINTNADTYIIVRLGGFLYRTFDWGNKKPGKQPNYKIISNIEKGLKYIKNSK
jgi:hypothetical protein